jgi:hypothetical protein
MDKHNFQLFAIHDEYLSDSFHIIEVMVGIEIEIVTF